jgi:hypothetical protein
MLFGACGDEAAEVSTDTASTAAITVDTAAARTLRDSALATLATLAEPPPRATFDSVVVVQPPHDGQRLPAMAVCGRMAGMPGRPRSARFVYQSKWTVFVEEASNLTAFGELWARTCAATGGVVVRG